MRRLARVIALILMAAPVGAWAEGCGDTTFEGARFTVCEVDMAREELRLWLDRPDDSPWGSFRAIDEALSAQGARLGVAMNAGMYHSDRSPVGLYVEGGREGRSIVTSRGPGNFGMLPNGVFCIMEDRAAVIESRAYAERPPACTYATQSGPMLVIDNMLHPRFLPRSDSLNVRNGAGVSADGRRVYLVISNDRVNFHHFARFFRDRLETPNALYLDGSVSRLFDADSGRHDPGLPMGPIVGTVRRAN